MYRTESEANVYGFKCAPTAKPVACSKAKVQGVNVFKLAGYVLAIVAILAAVY